VNRLREERGYCGESARTKVAWAGLHLGEEPPLIGEEGSGTVFFTGCTLKCGSCQNCQLSRQGLGRVVTNDELVQLILRLQARGAENINLVTATHFAPAIVESVAAARNRGLSIPVVWNSSGYEQISTLQLLKETVDVYLPDCKTLDSSLSRRLMGAANYPEVVQPALQRMIEDKPLIVEEALVRQGVIVRHLVLPGLLEQSREVLRCFARHLKDRALLSLMFQYAPTPLGEGGAVVEGIHTLEGNGVKGRGPEAGGKRSRPLHLLRTVNRREYRQVLSWLEELGIEDGFLQEPVHNSDWLPDFTRENPFPEDQAVPVWHHESDYLPG
jgi:putative pyruvate formate lyase activating enzyme